MRLPNYSLAPLCWVGAVHSDRFASTVRAVQLMSGSERLAATLSLCWMVLQATACMHRTWLTVCVSYEQCTDHRFVWRVTMDAQRSMRHKRISTPGRWRWRPLRALPAEGPAGSRRRGCHPHRSCSQPPLAPPASEADTTDVTQPRRTVAASLTQRAASEAMCSLDQQCSSLAFSATRGAT